MHLNILKPIGLLLLCLHFEGLSQIQSEIWTPIEASKTEVKEKKLRKTIPYRYDIFTLQKEKLATLLEKSPSRGSWKTSSIYIDFPTENGVLQKFEVFEASVLSNKLQQKYPRIKSYVARGIEDPSAIARFSVSGDGLHVMITSAKHQTVYIDPYTADLQEYICYSRKELPSNPDNFECLVRDDLKNELPQVLPVEQKNANDGTLRTFRLALACTGEYSRFHWRNQNISDDAPEEDRKEAVLAAMNTTMTRVNGIFEQDLAITMVIVDNNADLIFLDPDTDGLNNNNANTLIDQSQEVCDRVIGFDNYDIGHTFSTGGGGLAALRAPCTSYKAEGITGSGRPIGDSYDIDYVAHEMGHQFGAGHTQNNSCNRSRNSSMEPGSASTIMGYAGICRPNIQNNSDDYFHAISIQQMWANLTSGNSTCGAETDTNNNPPSIAEIADYSIPAGTPFILKGNGDDPDTGDQLTYCWEQMDREFGPMPPEETSEEGPLFRSLAPSLSPDRYMPALATVLAGETSSTWEVTPTVSRDMKFRLTVRDNAISGGSTASENIVVTTDDTSGPFVVTSQSESDDWSVGSIQNITWNVANTDQAPVNCSAVDILLSVDGGNTFSIILAEGVVNDGNAEITVPDDVVTTTEARVMVAGADHIFYQVNASNFSIDNNSLSNEDFNNSLTDFRVWPNPTNGIVTISFPSVSKNTMIEAYDIRGRLVNTLKFKNTSGNTFNKTIDYQSLDSGIYFVSVINGTQKVTRRIIKK